MIKLTAIFIAAVLALSLTTSAAYAQNATSLQIQIVPSIQRGHQQHLTIFAVDDQGEQVNGSGEIISSVENAKGILVGPKTVYTESGEIVSYKVGPNTSPQNITVNSCLSDSELCAEQNYYVYPKGQAQQPQPPAPEFPPAIPVPTEEPTPEVPVTNDSEDGEITVPANETEVTLPENATDVTVNDTGEAEPLPPITNETAPIPEQPEIPIEVNETIPIPIPSNETTGNETIPVPLPINETDTNQTIPIPELPVEPDVPPTAEAGNQTEELPTEIPAQNETDTIPIELPINSSTGNETIPIPEIPIEPVTNETAPAGGGGNETVELTPVPPVINETTPLPINETAGGNETIPVPIPINETQANETLPIPELPVTNQTQNTTVEPEPIPGTGGETPNGTTPIESETPTNTNGNETAPIEPEPEPETPANATGSFEQLANATAIQDQKLDEVRDDGNDANRGELKALIGETSGAIGQVSEVVANATNDQLLVLQDASASVSESIDEVINPNEAEDEGDQGENEQ